MGILRCVILEGCPFGPVAVGRSLGQFKQLTTSLRRLSHSHTHYFRSALICPVRYYISDRIFEITRFFEMEFIEMWGSCSIFTRNDINAKANLVPVERMRIIST